MSESDRERELQFHLVGVPEAFGHEIEHRVISSGVTFTTVLIRESADLILSSVLKVEFEIPAGYPSPEAGQIRVFTDNIEPFRACKAVVSCPSILSTHAGRPALNFPWMADTKYPISVWFYTVRNLLKNTSSRSSALATWATPLLRRTDFPHRRRFHRSKSSASQTKVQIVTGAGRTRGKRPYMEDADFSFGSTRLSDAYPAVQVVGVLDGHGGAECAQFVADELPGVVSSIARREGGTNSLSRGSKMTKASVAAAALPEILFKAYIQIDADFIRTTSHTSGSTACILLRDADSGRIYVGNAGDTRAVLCRGGRAVDITIDRKATDPDEIARVAVAGGHVTKGRVMGSLAVARALGDAQLKKGRNLKHGSWASGTEALIVDPEITAFRPRRTGNHANDDEFIIIATDGLWDVMSSQAAVDAVRKSLSESTARASATAESSSTAKDRDTTAASIRESDLVRIANNMASQAVEMGSLDNVTVMLVHFTGHDDVGAYNSDDDDCGYTSDEGAATATATAAAPLRPVLVDSDRSEYKAAAAAPAAGYNKQPSSSSSGSAKEFDFKSEDISSLLENVPNKFSSAPYGSSSSDNRFSLGPQKTTSAASGTARSSATSAAAAAATLAKPAAAQSKNKNKSKSSADDDLDMDFLLDDSNF